MTAELAITLPALTAVLALLLLGTVVGVTQLRLEEAAGSAARSLARGDSVATATAAAQQIAGGRAETTVVFESGFVQVHVSSAISGPLSGLISWPLAASAIARVESVSAATGREAPGHGRPP
ncbi:MAG: hypothetical protein M3017_03270 [Actinomycetota bacterium]|nr:hypothetical protein [Actinomycetota bacterium]